jgi:hypothetical protein
LCEAVSVHAVDINADQDVHVIGTVQDDHNVVILWEKRANESLPWLERTISSDLEWPAVVHAADVDGDGDTDIVGAAEGSDAVVWWENLGDADPRFLQHTIRENLDGAFSVYATDINGDANVDLLCAAYGDDSVVWWENTGSKPVTFAEHNITSSFEGARIVYATDVDGDGDVDILGAAMDADSIAWWENSGGPSPSFAEHIIDGGFDGASCVHAADLDGDGDTDVVGTAALADEIAWWEHKPSGDSLPLDPVNWTKHTIKN